jgi:predicted P-loop ATPase
VTGRIDFAAIAAALDPSTVVPTWLPNGKRQGREWVARNPNRADGSPGSFSVNLTTGAWADFATGDKGGDLVGLYAFLFTRGDMGEAARQIQTERGITVTAEDRQAVVERAKVRELEKPRVNLQPPGPAASLKHFKFGDPSLVFEYRSRKGDLMMYVARFDPPGARKQIIPFTWCRHPDGTERWTWRGITGDDKRPLYGLDRLDARADAPVLIVEGEKTADAAQRLLGDAFAVLAWLGGVESADKVALGHLKGRDVVLWPDADAKVYPDQHPLAGSLLPLHEQPGIRAMVAIANGLKGVAANVRLVPYAPNQDADGWDLADAVDEGWTADAALALITERATSVQDALAPPKAPAAPAQADDQDTPAQGITDLAANLSPWGFPHVGDKGAILSSLENVDHLLRAYGIATRYNAMKRDVEIDVPGRPYGDDNREAGAMAEIVSLAARNRVPRENLGEFIRAISDRQRYHPVLDWIRSRPWDGRTRIDALADTLKSPIDARLKRQLLLRWLLSAVAALVTPGGLAAHGVLVLSGDQGIGKTSWVKALVPAGLDAVKEGAIIDPANKDSVLAAVSHWLVELGELGATFKKADIDRLKAFVTTAVDKIRRPYDRVESKLPRRTVFFGSVNDKHYLVDDTGNRRWWTIPVLAIDYRHGIDVQQLWAEILELHQGGEQHWLTPTELADLNALNDEHQAIDPVDELLRGGFAWDEPATQAMTATDALIAVGVDRPNRQQANHAAAVLARLTGAQSRKSNGRKVFDLPPKRGQVSAGGPF